MSQFENALKKESKVIISALAKFMAIEDIISAEKIKNTASLKNEDLSLFPSDPSPPSSALKFLTFSTFDLSEKNFEAIIATVVENKVARMAGIIIEAGAEAPATALTVMTPSGRMVTLDVLMARKSTMESVAVPFSGFISSSSFIAFMPIGVAAFPRPSILAEMFIIIADRAGCPSGMFGKSRFITG